MSAYVITLSVSHAASGLPVTALVMIIVARSAGHKKQGLMHDIATRFMGLIVLAMRVQFTLTGLRALCRPGEGAKDRQVHLIPVNRHGR